MLSFQEDTTEEDGFAALWDRHIAPGLNQYSRQYYGCVMLLSVGWPVLAASFLWIVWAFQHHDDAVIFGLDGQKIIIIAAAFGAGLGYVIYLPFKALTSLKKASFKTAIDEHFKDRLIPFKDTDAMEQAVDALHERDILPRRNPTINAAYESRDGLFRFYNIVFSQMQTQGNSTRHEKIPYLVLEMKLNQTLASEIRILINNEWDNFFRRLFRRNPNVQLINDEFEKLFEVFGDDPDLVKSIFTPDVQQSFVEMQHYFFTPYSRWTGSRRITAGLRGDIFTIAFHGLDDVAGERLAIQSPKKLVQSAKTAIQRMHEVIEIVETLRRDIRVIKRP